MPDTSLGDLLGIRFSTREKLSFAEPKFTPTVDVKLTMDQLNALIALAEGGPAELVPGTVPTLKLARINLRRSLR